MTHRKLLPRLILATLSAIACAFAASAQEPVDAETPPAELLTRLFVSDKLVLNVYSEPQQTGARVATIETGDVVAELERADNFVRVRLDDGREGWVGASYLTTDQPAAVRLRELQREQKAPAADKKTTEELARLRKENTTLSAQVKKLEASAAARVAVPAAAEDVPAEDETWDETEPAPQEDIAPASTASRTTLWIALLTAVVAGAAGFIAGYQMLARRIREKFGGLKVYQ